MQSRVQCRVSEERTKAVRVRVNSLVEHIFLHFFLLQTLGSSQPMQNRRDRKRERETHTTVNTHNRAEPVRRDDHYRRA